MKEPLDFYATHKPTACNTKDIDLSLSETEIFPDTIYVGELTSLTGASFPALLPTKDMNGLCFLSTPDNADQVLQCIQGIILRLLLDLPPGLCKLTLYDGTAAGANLIELSGLSPKIKGEKILTDPEELRRALNAIKNEMPHVVQRVLGHRYMGKTLIDYNHDAGELAHPYQVLVIADFPHSLTRETCKTIERIMQTGRQAGIFVILNIDGTYAPSKQIDFDIHPMLQKMATVYQSATSHDWYVKNTPLEQWINKGFFFQLAEKFPEGSLDPILEEINTRLTLQTKATVTLLDELTPTNLWTRDASSGVQIPIGKTNFTEVQDFVLSLSDGITDTPHHCLVGGATGSGKTVLLHDIICNGAWFYSPQTLQFILLDYKEGTEFNVYKHLPHVRVLSMRSEQDYGISVLNYVNQEIERRGDLFKELNVSNITKYNIKATKPIPRILIIIDEFQKLLEGTKGATVANALDDIGRRGRSFGINLILSTQSLSGITFSQVLSHLGLRITLRLDTTRDCDALLGIGNHAPFTDITKVGEGIYNARGGLPEGNRRFQTAYISDNKLNYIVHQIEKEAIARYGINGIGKRFIYDGEVAAFIGDNPALPSGSLPVNESVCTVYVGEPVALTDTHTYYHLKKQNGGNVLVVGMDTTAATSILHHSIHQIIAQSGEDVQCFICDKLNADGEGFNPLQQIASLASVSYNQDDQTTEGVIHQLKEILGKRQRKEEPSTRILLVITDPYNVRNLRKSGYNMSPITKELQEVMRDGPICGIHTLLYFKTYANFSAILDPANSLQEFDTKIELMGGDGYKIFGTLGSDIHKATLTRSNIAYIAPSADSPYLQRFKIYTL